MAYGDFKYLAKRTASIKVLRDEAFTIVKNPNYDGYQRGPGSMVYKFSIKNLLLQTVVSAIKRNEQLA